MHKQKGFLWREILDATANSARRNARGITDRKMRDRKMGKGFKSESARGYRSSGVLIAKPDLSITWEINGLIQPQ